MIECDHSTLVSPRKIGTQSRSLQPFGFRGVARARPYSSQAGPQRPRGSQSSLSLPTSLPPSTPAITTLPSASTVPSVSNLPSVNTVVSTVVNSTVLALVPVLTIKWDINPVTFPQLFDPNIPGSLYHSLSPGLLNMINAAAQGHPGLIPIVLVHDMANDPSFIVRTIKDPFIYMWTLKPEFWLNGCSQYVGQTISARGRFGKNYNSPQYLFTHPSQFYTLLHTMGQSAFYVTIIALTGPSPWEWRWMETLFIFLFSTTLNSARISGSNIGVQQRAMNAASLARKRVAALRNLPSTSHAGANNPYFGKVHSPEIRNAISVANGTALDVFELHSDQSSTLLGTFNSATKAAAALANLGIHISRPSVMKFLRGGQVFNYKGRHVYFISK